MIPHKGYLLFFLFAPNEWVTENTQYLYPFLFEYSLSGVVPSE